jgi:hypothetical protein
VNSGKQLVLFDTGNGTLRRDHERLRSRLPDGHLGLEQLLQSPPIAIPYSARRTMSTVKWGEKPDANSSKE